jgi:hypothetical protein
MRYVSPDEQQFWARWGSMIIRRSAQTVESRPPLQEVRSQWMSASVVDGYAH